ncbi:MAG: hypothetical protein IIV27_05090, partial [Clostridia bacterium]|nr:hypothetical protein [Clostridia bacterium]
RAEAPLRPVHPRTGLIIHHKKKNDFQTGSRFCFLSSITKFGTSYNRTGRARPQDWNLYSTEARTL